MIQLTIFLYYYKQIGSMNKTIMIAATIVAFIAGTLVAGTWVEAEPSTTEPMVRPTVKLYVEEMDFVYGAEVISFKSDAPFKIDFCATHNSKKPVQFGFDINGFPDVLDAITNIAPNDIKCLQAGGNASDVVYMILGGQGSQNDSEFIRAIITTFTTPTGTIIVEACEIGVKGPINCRHL